MAKPTPWHERELACVYGRTVIRVKDIDRCPRRRIAENPQLGGGRTEVRR
jgi:hypothetical protein